MGQYTMKDKAFDLIRNLPILETHSAHFLRVLELGTVSTNVYLRRIHNFALDMNWLPWPSRDGDSCSIPILASSPFVAISVEKASSFSESFSNRATPATP